MPYTPVHVFGLGLPVLESGASAPRFRRLEHPVIAAADVLIGGAAQLASYNDHPAEKITVGKHMDALYAAMQANSAAGKRQAVLCGGDPLFYGLGARLSEKLGAEHLRIHPSVSSLQAAAALTGLPWEALRSVSLHGRSDWFPLAHALLGGTPVFVLTDDASSPAAIAAWMLQRGLWRYSMQVLENMYLDHDGAVQAFLNIRLSLPQAQTWASERGQDSTGGPVNASLQRVVLIVPDTSLLPASAAQPWPFGLADADVVKENRLLTKSPIRAASLAALSVEPWHTVWDLGAGSGAVSLEAARLAWQGRVYAVEKNSGRVAIIRENRSRYGAANLEIIEGEMPACLPAHAGREQQEAPSPTGQGSVLPCPERIFIGGGLGGDRVGATAILSRAWEALAPGGRMVVDCVLLSSLELARAALFRLGARVNVSSIQASTSSSLANDMRLEALNPIFLILAEKIAPGSSAPRHVPGEDCKPEVWKEEER